MHSSFQHSQLASRNGIALFSTGFATFALLWLAAALWIAPGSAFAESSLSAAEVQLTSASIEQARISDGVYIVALARKKNVVLDVSGGSEDDDAAIEAWSANGTPAQRWRFERLPDGTFRITNVASGKVLGVSKSSIAKGAAVHQRTWKESRSQKWTVRKDGKGYFLSPAASGAYALGFARGKTTDGTAAVLCKPSATKACRLALKRIKPAVQDGTYQITCAASGKPLQAAGGSIDKGTNLQMGPKGKSLERIFSLKYDERSGYYRMLSAASGFAASIDGTWGYSGANVKLNSLNGSKAQQWAISRKADGTFAIRSAAGGYALDVLGGSSATGTNVQLYDPNGTDAQIWRIEPVKRWLRNGTYVFTSCADTSRSVTVSGSSKKAHANVQLAARDNTPPQQWKVTYNKRKGAYTIRNKHSKLVLEAAGSAKDGANVRQAKATGKANQLWVPHVAAGGIVFRPLANPKAALGIANATGSAEGNVVVSTGEAGGAQKFRLRDATLPVFKVYLNPGHGWNSNDNGAWDTGAQGSGYAEADFTHDLTRRVQAYCESYGIDIVNGEKYQLAYWKRMPKAVSLGCDVIVSIHFDWSGAGVSGTHTMVGVQGKAPGSDLLNKIIHRHLVAATGLRDLGTFSRSDITAVNGAIPSMLMEVCFMDNAGDVRTYLSRRDKIAKAIADGILEASQHPSLHR